MRWKPRPINPITMPFGADGLTYNPGLVVETSRIANSLELVDEPIWGDAPLTREARRRVPHKLCRGWRVRLRGGRTPCALVLRVRIYVMYGCISAAPERAETWVGDSILVLTPALVVSIPGTSKHAAYGHLADILLGTRPAPRRRPPPVPVDDIEALRALAP